MPQRLRKLIGGVAIVAFLCLYIALAVAVAQVLPQAWPVKLAYFLVVGSAWGAPLIPLINWMNRGG